MTTTGIVGSVAELWRFPVKSMKGERLAQAQLTEADLVADRAYALIDADTGKEVMTQDIGIVAGSAEGAALCYRTICLEAPTVMGEHNHPEITMNSVPMAEHMRHIRANDWQAVARLLAASARKVAQAGANF